MSKISATLSNVVAALSNSEKCGFEFKYYDKNTFLISEHGMAKWRPVTDADIVAVRLTLEQQSSLLVSKSIARDAMMYVGTERVKSDNQP